MENRMNKVYACTDLHGQYDLWKKISNYCDKTDTIYFLGDAIDRGKNGDKILIELLNDPRVIYLRGNHEQLMIDSAPYLFGEEADDIDFYTWIYNEGKDTYENLFLNKPIDYTKKIIADLKKLPTFASYINKKNQKISFQNLNNGVQ
jgi:serine/threonine protein phosphatase 1